MEEWFRSKPYSKKIEASHRLEISNPGALWQLVILLVTAEALDSAKGFLSRHVRSGHSTRQITWDGSVLYFTSNFRLLKFVYILSGSGITDFRFFCFGSDVADVVLLENSNENTAGKQRVNK